jgi:hypothetical protein
MVIQIKDTLLSFCFLFKHTIINHNQYAIDYNYKLTIYNHVPLRFAKPIMGFEGFVCTRPIVGILLDVVFTGNVEEAASWVTDGVIELEFD